ncbi:response regulator transcription factor [Agromyces larvae]|uniref:Response regulator transcription factor n=1 Tax=Agromyces larvae TaxID=2929802 RepID=A0ABY4C1J2_9MICO|nr:response regulator transcription factor [Agromyces larvae]UOE43828.1 response regulator transcription factor [Agromyces larvae]
MTTITGTATRTTVRVYAHDPISEAGVVSALRPRPEVRVVGPDDEPAAVVVVVVDDVDDETLNRLRFLRRNGEARVILVASHLDDQVLVDAVECGVVGLLRRSEATTDRLLSSIASAAAGEGTVPPDLLGRLLEQVGRLQRTVLDPRGITFRGLAAREVDVLRLVAEGWDTAQIAKELCYSERTVKNVLHDVTTRLQLRNRSHAVAYAVREGLI